MSSYRPFQRGNDHSPRCPDRARAHFENETRPVVFRRHNGELVTTANDDLGQFQSDGDFATEAKMQRAIDAARALNPLLLRIELAIIGAVILWAVLPPFCMWLAGGTPA